VQWKEVRRERRRRREREHQEALERTHAVEEALG